MENTESQVGFQEDEITAPGIKVSTGYSAVIEWDEAALIYPAADLQAAT